MSTSKIILIVDDSRVSRVMISAIVKDKKPDWEILQAGDAEEALKIVEGKCVDFFSLDLNMPGIDGFELIEKLKLQFPDAVYALLTANIQQATHLRAKELGAFCINKPINETSIGQMLEYFHG